MTLSLHFGRILTGSEGGQSRPEKDIPGILHVLADGKIDWRSFVSHQGTLSELDQIIQQMRSGLVIHAVLDFRA